MKDFMSTKKDLMKKYNKLNTNFKKLNLFYWRGDRALRTL